MRLKSAATVFVGLAFPATEAPAGAFVDKNGYGVLCVQDIPQRGETAPVSGSCYAVVLVDDNAAVRS